MGTSQKFAFLVISLVVNVPGDVGCGTMPKTSAKHPQGLEDALTDIIPYKIFYSNGKSEKDLPECAPSSVCNKVDVYDQPWIQRQCRCPGNKSCSVSLDILDGYTIVEKTRYFKLCNPINNLPKCRYFRDITWTYFSYPNNMTQQVVNCVCPKHSVAYIIKRSAFYAEERLGFQYAFACSPQSKMRCQRKEPCRLFSVKKRHNFEDVNSNTLCKCPHSLQCPTHHTREGVIPGKIYAEDGIRTFSAYCV